MKIQKKKLCALVAIAIMAFHLAPAAQAQPTKETSETGQAANAETADTAAPSQQMGAITVTATRQKERVLDVPATISVISREEMDEHNVNNIQELVRYQPGIRVNRQASGTTPFGGLSGFTIRGVGGNRIQTVVDGARVIESNDGGNRDFVDLSMMKAVEIQRGPGSVLWGADALGGIVSYRTLDPDDLLNGNTVGGKASYGFDGLNAANTQNAMFAMQISPDMQFLMGYTHRTYNETRLRNAKADGGQWGCTRVALGCDRFNPTDAEVNNAIAKLVYRPNADHELKLTGEFFGSDTTINQLYDRGLSSGMATTTINSGDHIRNQKQTRQRAAFEHSWDVNAAALDNLSWRVSYSPQERRLHDRRNYQTRTGTLTSDMYATRNTEYSEDFSQADIQFTSSFALASSEHTLTYGFQGDRTDTDYYRKDVTNNLTSGTSTTTYGSGTNFANAETIRADLYLQDEMKFFERRLTITPGIRHAHYSLDPSPDRNYGIIAGKEPTKVTENKWLPQIGLLFKIDSMHSLYGRYAEGFKMPTAEQLYTSYDMGVLRLIPNPDLKPEEVKSYEAGIRGQYSRGWFSFGGFYSDYTNFIKSRQPVAGTAADYTYQNLDKVKLWGFEASGEWRFAQNWSVSGGATYQHGKQTSTNSGKYVPFDAASPLSGNLGLRWNQPEYKLSTELIGTFSRRITRVSDEDYYKPGGYGVFDSYVNWQIDKNFKLTASVLNIFNKRYFEQTASTMNAYPTSASQAYTNPLELYTAPGRTFAVTLSASF